MVLGYEIEVESDESQKLAYRLKNDWKLSKNFGLTVSSKQGWDQARLILANFFASLA